ncbi:Response regulator receiver domain-containing protein [Robiginitalea myxolifaciens]|uniref:Response regulator receiver domain-containing protein n=1 Tax=Robiginitalea myxolifaciens TaxID=400055 RepID=A0A1I6FP86_9FLAO|nr:response regulator [Robiginitalea myxolifaciens]SFR31762.1 Response regulator receiver domain-containing protein [Robiginitalea myxolifaciens]
MHNKDLLWIIDDDPILVYGIKKMLLSEFPEMNIETFPNGQEAIDAFHEALSGKQSLPDLLLLDLNMPIMDGWQFLEELLPLRPAKRLKIDILTSSIDPADMQRFDRIQKKIYHQLSYQNKPMTRESLVRMIAGTQ